MSLVGRLCGDYDRRIHHRATVYGPGDTHNSRPNRFTRQTTAKSAFCEGVSGRDHVAVEDVASVIVRSMTQVEKEWSSERR